MNAVDAPTKLRDALTQLGVCYRERGIITQEVSFKDTWYCEDIQNRGPVVGLVVDVANLPYGVDAGVLTTQKTLHHLETVLERRIAWQNSRGVEYAIFLDEPPESAIPDLVPFDFEHRPEGNYMVPLGVGPVGPVWSSLGELDCVLVAGTRGMGKSNFVHCLIASLVKYHTPEQLRLVLIDPKRLDFGAWATIPHLMGEIAREPHEAALVLDEMFKELNMRSALLTSVGCRHIDRYNAQAEEPLPRILIVVDEVGELTLVGAEAIESLQRLLSLGSAFGLHFIIATQRPGRESLSGLIKANLSTRISFWFRADLNYRIALDPPKGGQVPRIKRHRGRCVVGIDDDYQVLQAYHLDDDTLLEIAAEVEAGRSLPIPRKHLMMLLWAWKDNGGYLSIQNADHFLGERVKGEKPRKALCKDLERAGWLEKDPSRNNMRRLTEMGLGIVQRFEDLWEEDSTQKGESE